MAPSVGDAFRAFDEASPENGWQHYWHARHAADLGDLTGAIDEYQLAVKSSRPAVSEPLKRECLLRIDDIARFRG